MQCARSFQSPSYCFWVTFQICQDTLDTQINSDSGNLRMFRRMIYMFHYRGEWKKCKLECIVIYLLIRKARDMKKCPYSFKKLMNEFKCNERLPNTFVKLHTKMWQLILIVNLTGFGITWETCWVCLWEFPENLKWDVKTCVECGWQHPQVGVTGHVPKNPIKGRKEGEQSRGPTLCFLECGESQSQAPVTGVLPCQSSYDMHQKKSVL